jgi:hypothetical protein
VKSAFHWGPAIPAKGAAWDIYAHLPNLEIAQPQFQNKVTHTGWFSFIPFVLPYCTCIYTLCGTSKTHIGHYFGQNSTKQTIASMISSIILLW